MPGPADPLRAECLQPGNLGLEVIGMNVDVHPDRAVTEFLDQQAEGVAVRAAVVLGM